MLIHASRLIVQSQSRGDFELTTRLYAPDSELRNIATGGTAASILGLQDVYRGPAGVRRFFEEWAEPWEHWHWAPEGELFDLGEGRLLFLLELVGIGRGSGIEVREQVGLLPELERGLTVRQHNWLGTDAWSEALRTAGVTARPRSGACRRSCAARVEYRAQAAIHGKGVQMSGGQARAGDSGWAAFAGVVMFIVGSLDALWGLAAILNDDVVIVGGHGAIIADITMWGWVHLILGSIIALTGLGLLTGNAGARVLAVFFLAVNAVSQIVWFSSAPLWAFLLILLDVVIIYQLTARWDAQAAWD